MGLLSDDLQIELKYIIFDKVIHHIDNYGLYGPRLLFSPREYDMGNIKFWTEKDWDDVMREPQNYYIYVDVRNYHWRSNTYVYIINIFKRRDPIGTEIRIRVEDVPVSIRYLMMYNPD